MILKNFRLITISILLSIFHIFYLHTMDDAGNKGKETACIKTIKDLYAKSHHLNFKSLPWDNNATNHTNTIQTQKQFFEYIEFPATLVTYILRLHQPKNQSNTLNEKYIPYKRSAPCIIPETVKLIPHFGCWTGNIEKVFLGFYAHKKNNEPYIQLYTRIDKNSVEKSKIIGSNWSSLQLLDGMPDTQPIIGKVPNQAKYDLGFLTKKNSVSHFCQLQISCDPLAFQTCSFFTKGTFPFSISKLVISTYNAIITADVTARLNSLYLNKKDDSAIDISVIPLSVYNMLCEKGFKKLFCITNRTLIGLTNSGIIYTIPLDVEHKCSIASSKYFYKQTFHNLSKIKDLNKDPEDPTRLIIVSETGDICFLSLHNRVLIRLCNNPKAESVWLHRNLIMMKQLKKCNKHYQLCFVDGNALLDKTIL